MGTFFGRSSPYRLFAIFVLASLLMVALPAAALAAPAPSADTAPLAHGDWYVVQPGDTLSQIALRYGTTVSALMAADALKKRISPLNVEHYQSLVTPHWYEQ